MACRDRSVPAAESVWEAECADFPCSERVGVLLSHSAVPLVGDLTASPQLLSLVSVTPEAQRPDIGQVAFSATLHNGPDMIGIPEAASARMNVQPTAQLGSPFSWQPLKSAIEFDSVQSASRTNAPVPVPYLFPQVPWICPQPPLVNAEIVAKRTAPLRHFRATPSADAPAVCPTFTRPADPASGLFSIRAHLTLRSLTRCGLPAVHR